MKKRQLLFALAVLLVIVCLGGCRKSAGQDYWPATSVFYEIFVRSFYDSDGNDVGDFNGVTEKVGYLKELGVNAVWLMPITKSTTYHGYDVVDYMDVEPDYGTMADFENMVKVLHDNGIKVIIDFVVNHTSSSNPWFQEALSNPSSKYRDYYEIYDSEPEGISNIRYDRATGQYYYGHFDIIMPDLNYKNQNVRDDIKAAAGFWLDKGVDGFRLDASNMISEDLSITHSWWNEFGSYVYEKKPDAFVVGENWVYDTNDLAIYYEDMNSSFDFSFARNAMDMAGGSMIDYLPQMKRDYARFKARSETGVPPSFTISTMLTNHDMDRIVTRLDTVDKARLAANLLFTLPGTPFVYYGDELGQMGQSPDDRRREPFDWYASAQGPGMTVMTDKFFNPPSRYTIANDGISYEEQKDNPASMFSHYKKLIAIRNSYKELYSPLAYNTLAMSSSGLYAYTVDGNKYKILVVHNQSSSPQSFTLKVDGTDLYAGNDVKSGSYRLSAYSSLILKYAGGKTPVDPDEFIFEVEIYGDYTVTMKLTIPENTPMDENVYLVGDFNGWNPQDENFIMERTSQTTCEISLVRTGKSVVEYKFTRGSWDMREQNASGEDLVGVRQRQNRDYKFEDDDFVLNIEVEKWSDL